MSTRVFTGSFAALEVQLTAEIEGLQREDPLAPVRILVGSNLLAGYLRVRLAETGRTVANVELMTFAGLVRRLSRPEPSDDRPLLPAGAPQLLVEAVLTERPPSVFKSVSGFPGFRDALIDTFRDLRDAGVYPPSLHEALRRVQAREPDRQPHLSALAELYDGYRRNVSRFRDSDDDYRRAMQGAAGAPGLLGSPSLLVYGFYDVTGLQADLLDSLEASLDVIHLIPYADEQVAGFARAYVDARRKAGPAAVALPDLPARTDLERLCSARSGFSTPRPGAICPSGVPDGTLAFVSAPGDSRLALEVVREVVRAVADGVIHDFSEAAVLVRHPAALLPVLEEAFRMRGISCFLHGGRPLLDTPLAGAVLCIVRLAQGSFPRDSVLKAFELAAASSPSVLGDWNTAEWRLLTNQARFLSGFAAWETGTLALVRLAEAEARRASIATTAEDPDREHKTAAEAEARLISARKLFGAWKGLAAASSAWPAQESWGGWKTLLVRRLEPMLGGSPDWASFTAVLDSLGQLEALDRAAGIGNRVSFERMLSALEQTVRRYAVRVGRFGRSGVNLMGVGAARGLRFPLVIVAGLEEGRFPARLRQDPLLLDSERVSVGQPGRLPLKSLRGDEEKLLFDMAVRSARRRLVVATSRLDEETDRELFPSEFFLRAASAAAGRTLTARELSEAEVPGFRSVSLENPAPRAGLPAVDEGEIRLRLITGIPADRRRSLEALSLELPELLARPFEYLRARWAPYLTKYDGRIFDRGLAASIARRLGPSAGPVSASRIEEYAACPYRFFLRRVMGLEAWEEAEPAEALDPLERGTVVHSILEGFLQRFKGERFLHETPENLRKSLMDTAGPLLDNARPAGIPSLLWEIERGRLEALLVSWLDFEVERRNEGLFPELFEFPFGSFGGSDGEVPLVLKGGVHSFEFRGRIDRVDRSRDGTRARVVDYKTGRFPAALRALREDPLMGGERVQIAVYREALRLTDPSGGSSAARGEYLHLDPREGVAVPGQYTEEMLRDAASRLPSLLEIVGDGLTNGVFFRRTDGTVWGERNCNHCDYPSVCGRDRRACAERKEGDPEVLRLAALREAHTITEEEE